VGVGEGEVGGLTEVERTWVNWGRDWGVLVDLTSGSAAEVGFPGLGDPGVEQDWRVVTVMVLVLKTVT
jgi:hypothetical protein